MPNSEHDGAPQNPPEVIIPKPVKDKGENNVLRFPEREVVDAYNTEAKAEIDEITGLLTTSIGQAETQRAPRGVVGPVGRQERSRDGGDGTGGEKKKGVKWWLIGVGAAVATSAAMGMAKIEGWFGGGDNGPGVVPSPISTKSPEVSPSRTPPESAIASAIASATLSPSPTETIIPTATPEVISTVEQKLELAPEIEGLNKEIREINGLKRVVYVAEAGNAYGLKEGDYAGEYKYEVKMGEEQTGGIALVAKVAEPLLLKAIDQRTEEQGKFLIPLAADIADLKTNEEVDLKLDAEIYGFPDVPYIIAIYFDNNETIDVVNVIPGINKIMRGVGQKTGLGFSRTELQKNSKNRIIKGREMEYISVAAKYLSNPTAGFGTDFKFGQTFGQTSEAVAVEMSSNDEPRVQSFDELFKIDGMPVFVTNNK